MKESDRPCTDSGQFYVIGRLAYDDNNNITTANVIRYKAEILGTVEFKTRSDTPISVVETPSSAHRMPSTINGGTWNFVDLIRPVGVVVQLSASSISKSP